MASRKRTTQSRITPQRIRQSILNRFNPLRDFTYEKLVRQLEAFHAGYLSDAARTWEAMERRNIYLGNVASKRKKSVARLPWEIQLLVPDGPDGTPDKELSAQAEKQKEVLLAFYRNIEVTSVLEQNERGGLSLLVRQMMDAVGKKFAVHEIVWRPTPGQLGAQFRFCPLWWFENTIGKLRYLPQEFMIEGEEMADGEWLVTVGEGIMESCSVMDLLRGLPLKDWASFSEKFGMPGLLGKTPATVDSEEWKAMEDAVRNFMNDWAAVVNNGGEITLVEPKSGGTNLPFAPLVEYCDRAIAARWRGADLSTISSGKQSEGTGASLQGDESDLILEDDAELISEALNRQVDRFVLDYAFGAGVETLARIRVIGTSEDEALSKFKREVFTAFLADKTVADILANQTDLKELVTEVQLPVNREYVDPYVPVTDEQGRPLTGNLLKDAEGDIIGAEPGSVPDGPNGPNDQGANNGKGRAGSLENEKGAMTGAETVIADSRKAFAEGTRGAFKPVAERLQEILQIENQTVMKVELQKFLTSLESNPVWRSLVSPKQIEALQRAMEEGLRKGASASRTGK